METSLITRRRGRRDEKKRRRLHVLSKKGRDMGEGKGKREEVEKSRPTRVVHWAEPLVTSCHKVPRWKKYLPPFSYSFSSSSSSSPTSSSSSLSSSSSSSSSSSFSSPLCVVLVLGSVMTWSRFPSSIPPVEATRALESRRPNSCGRLRIRYRPGLDQMLAYVCDPRSTRRLACVVDHDHPEVVHRLVRACLSRYMNRIDFVVGIRPPDRLTSKRISTLSRPLQERYRRECHIVQVRREARLHQWPLDRIVIIDTATASESWDDLSTGGGGGGGGGGDKHLLECSGGVGYPSKERFFDHILLPPWKPPLFLSSTHSDRGPIVKLFSSSSSSASTSSSPSSSSFYASPITPSIRVLSSSSSSSTYNDTEDSYLVHVALPRLRLLSSWNTDKIALPPPLWWPPPLPPFTSSATTTTTTSSPSTSDTSKCSIM